MKRLLSILLLCLFMPTMTQAAGGHTALKHAPVDLENKASLRKGARTFVNYCLGCHSANYMRYNRMGKDLGITEDVLKENFMFGTDKPGDTMTIALQKSHDETYFGPDLSVIARSRGADWLYTYLLTFYLDDSRDLGVNNLVFKDVGMPHVLWELQGWQKAVYETVEHADGTTSEVVKELELVEEGLQTPEEYQQTVADLVNFLVYMGEPAQLQRKKVGFWVLFYLILILLPVTYLLKKEYWRDVH